MVCSSPRSVDVKVCSSRNSHSAMVSISWIARDRPISDSTRFSSINCRPPRPLVCTDVGPASSVEGAMSATTALRSASTKRRWYVTRCWARAWARSKWCWRSDAFSSVSPGWRSWVWMAASVRAIRSAERPSSPSTKA
ncbi:hypothetical protein ASC87_15890 [Rhizobacter sp. Root1221]|nr:hypothetical protein ASC87_15890 [Rhizobacter sp. Root1221]